MSIADHKLGLGRRDVLRLGVAAGATLAAPTVLRAQSTIRLTFGTGFPPVLAWVKEATETFIPAVDAELARSGSGLTVDWTLALSGTIAKPEAMMEATSQGICQVALLAPIFEPTNLPLDNIGFVTPFTVPDHRIASRVVNAMHAELPAMRDSWARNNLVHLGSLANEGYVWLTDFAWNSLSDLKGHKISGAGMALPWIKATGAVAVATNFATAYNEMSVGLFSGIQGFPGALAATKMFELAKHLKRLRLGAVSTLAFAANLDEFNNMPEDLQAALKTAGAATAKAYEARVDAIEKGAFGAFAAAGCEITDLSEEQNQLWADSLPPLAGEWAESFDAQGVDATGALKFYMRYLRDNSVPVLRDWTK